MASAEKRPPGPNILINKKHYKAPSEEMTGAELKELGAIPAGNKLFKEEPGQQPDSVVNNGDTVALHDGDRFYDLPPGVVG